MTIIILLILAIVTIAAISKSNIIEKTKTSKEEYSIGEEKEKVTLAVQEANLEGQGTINKGNVENGMNTYFGDGWEEITSDSGENSSIMTVQITASGRTYKINLRTGAIEKYLDENNSNKKDASFKFPKYGVIYSRFNKDDEVQFLIINENGINLYGATWDGEGAVFGEIQNTTYNDFRTSYRESGIKYEFVDLADAVNEDIEVTKNMGNWTEEEIQEIESIKNDASYCSKAIRSEIEDKGETSIEFYYFKDNYNELIYSSKRHEYTIEERFNNEDKAKLLNLINGDEIYDK